MYLASRAVRESNHPPSTSSSPPDYSLPWNQDNKGHNYGVDAHSSQLNYPNRSFPYYESFNHVPPSAINNSHSTFFEPLNQIATGYLTESSLTPLDPTAGVTEPYVLLYNAADSFSVLPRVSKSSEVGEIASGLDLPLQQQLLDPAETTTAPSQGKLPSHEPIQSTKPNQCLQCGECFDTMTQLNRHRKDSKHAAIKCKCGTTFGRHAELVRHLGPYQSTTPRFPCSFCTRYRGKDGFRRKDKLMQHMRGYHRITSEIKTDEDGLRRKKPTFECTAENCD